MGKVTLSKENKTKSYDGYPKLRLETGEKVRICLFDPDPEKVFVHNYRIPVVVNGEVQKEEKKGKNGNYTVPLTEWVASHRCTGDAEVVSKNSIDPDGCPQCAKVKENPELFSPPTPKFAQHVLRYKTVPGGYAVAKPFQADIVAWVYAERKFNELCDIAEEHGNMRKVDLLVECISKDFQNLNLQTGGTCEWISDKARAELAAEVYKESKCDSLEDLIAREATPTQLAMDWMKVKERHAQIGNPSAPAAGYEPSNLEDLLNGSSKSDGPDWAKDTADTAPSADAVAEAAGEGSWSGVSESPAAEAEGAKEPATVGGGTDEIDFDKMLDEL